MIKIGSVVLLGVHRGQATCHEIFINKDGVNQKFVVAVENKFVTYRSEKNNFARNPGKARTVRR